MEEEEEQLAVMAGETYSKLDKVISSIVFNNFQISIFLNMLNIYIWGDLWQAR